MGRHSLPSIMPAGLRSYLAEAKHARIGLDEIDSLRHDYAQARFTGFGGATVHQAAESASPILLNPVLVRLQEELALATEAATLASARYGSMDAHAFSCTPEGWAMSWRRWALADLTDQVAESQEVFVIHRGDSFQYRLFLDRAGQHLLAVQPDAPGSTMRYRKLGQDQDLCESFGPFARLAQSSTG
jgi:hypothetical protein